MTRNQDYLMKYTELETFLRKRNSRKTDDKYHFNIFQDKDIRREREKWDLYREIRNLLTHEEVFLTGMTVSESLYKSFVGDVDKIKHPQKVIDIAVPESKIYKVTEDEKINNVIQIMLDKNYTCTPVVNEKNVILGVFSAHSLMLYFNKHKQEILEDTSAIRIKDFYNFCNLYNNPDIAFKFVSRKTTVNEVKDMFKDNFKNNTRLEVIFITDTGKNTEKVLALLTPWDLNKCGD